MDIKNYAFVVRVSLSPFQGFKVLKELNMNHLLVRIIFAILCPLFLTLYITMGTEHGATFASMTIGIIGGIALSGIIMLFEASIKGANLQKFNLTLLGLFCGYLFGEALFLPINEVTGMLNLQPELLPVAKMIIFLLTGYLGVMLALRANEEFQLILPFIKFDPAGKKKKDIIVDSSTLLDTRIIDLALTGLLDNHLLLPKFIIKELNFMNEHGDEAAKAKARRCFEVIRKLESIPDLNLRYIDTDFPDLKDSITKLAHLARTMDATLMTADLNRPQPPMAEGIRTVNIHALSNAFKAIPQSGEFLTIKIQRKGKEPGQGVGYLEDGTMVVVNGGEEFIFETIKAQILSVKSTSSGRMVFCNAVDDDAPVARELVDAVSQMESSHKNYFPAREDD